MNFKNTYLKRIVVLMLLTVLGSCKSDTPIEGGKGDELSYSEIELITLH